MSVIKSSKNLTVIMSVYNGEPFLSEAIDSILNQTFKDFKFIIVDNGSSDKTPKTLNKYSELDNRIEIISLEKNLTCYAGRMAGIKECKTEWFALMDADDISKPDRLEKQMHLIKSDKESKLGAIGCWGEYINANGKTIGKIRTGPTSIKEYDNLFKKNEAILLIDPTSVINTKVFWECKGYRQEAYPPCDLDFWYRLSETGKKIIAIPEYLFKYRVHSNSYSVQKTMFQREMTHFVNYNMRKRRNKKDEITYLEFNKNIWSKWSYKLPRKYRDFAMLFYKKAGLNFCKGKYFKFLFYLIIVAIIRPKHIYQKLYLQNFSSLKINK